MELDVSEDFPLIQREDTSDSKEEDHRLLTVGTAVSKSQNEGDDDEGLSRKSDEQSPVSQPSNDENIDTTDVQDNAKLIQMATAAALEDAIAMKRSDSVLSASEDGTDISAEPDLTLPGLDRRDSTALNRYMEEASFEASLISPNRHMVAPSGKLGKKRSSSLSQEVIHLRMSSVGNDSVSVGMDIDDKSETISYDHLGDTQERSQSERGAFYGMSNLLSRSWEDANSNNDDAPPLATINSIPSEESDQDDAPYDSLEKILVSCGLDKPPTNSLFPDDVVLLHSIFRNFCEPPIDIESVSRALNTERGGNLTPITLPTDVIIQKPSAALVKLIGPLLFHVPKEFALGFFRILLRLLTSDTDTDYDREILTSCAWYNEIFGSPSIEAPRVAAGGVFKKHPSFAENSFSRENLLRENALRKADQVYNIVRLQQDWPGAITQVYNLLECLAQTDKCDHLFGPVIRLLGLLCTSGVSVCQLRQMLSLITELQAKPKAQLLLVRALRVATEGASRSSVLVGKASPRSFFSFRYGKGVRRAICLQKTPWPFRNDFGMALWFRAERFSASSTLLRVTNEAENGIEVSLLPLELNAATGTTATVLAVSVLENGQPSQIIRVNSCVLLSRVWYHVAIRHTRSRLKGVFSLSSREQLSIMLDGKTMLTESFRFPKIQESPNTVVIFTFGANFEGQTGGLYVFHDNVSDATFRALYESSAGTSGVVQKVPSVNNEWDSRRGDIAKKSKMLDLSMRRDDVEEIVLSHRSSGVQSFASATVIDLHDEDEGYDSNPLSKTAFSSKTYLVWDPQRAESDFALELHSGAHVRLYSENVRRWCVEGAQDVIGSIGGVQALLPVFRSVLSGSVEKRWNNEILEGNGGWDSSSIDSLVLCSFVPDLFLLLASFVREHNENAREMLRSGGVDIIEQLLQNNKKLSAQSRSGSLSLVSSICVFPSLSKFLTDSLIELHSACSHYVGLETKVFTRLLFNLQLWFGGQVPCFAIYPALLPVLSNIAKANPPKVRDCIGVTDIIQLLKDLVEDEVRGLSVLLVGAQHTLTKSFSSRTKLRIESHMTSLRGIPILLYL